MSNNNGGPAFPEISYKESLGGGSHIMTVYGGMTLRDYFAAKAMQGLVGASKSFPRATIAEHAYLMADAMLAEREKDNG